jgi:hypothetical protein
MKAGARADGSATAEAVLLCMVLLVPIVWLLGVLAQVHTAALATTAAAREAGAAASRAPDLSSASRLADRAAAAAFADAGLDRGEARLRLSTPGDLDRGEWVTTEVTYRVAVVTFPLLGSGPGPTITVRASHVSSIDPFADR